MTTSRETRAIDALFEAAADVRVRAHAPYSRFFVGAALLDEEGRTSTSAATSRTPPIRRGTCAEAGAISAMVAAGGRRILAIAIVGGPAEGDELQCPPCGGCRQKIREFAAETASIHLRDGAGHVTSLPLGELLPLSFGPDHL